MSGEPNHAELLAAAMRLLAGCSKVLAFPEKLPPNVKAMLHDQYTVTQEFVKQRERIERLREALFDIAGHNTDSPHKIIAQAALRKDGD